MKVTGQFQVSLKPQEPYGKSGNGINLGRMSIDKTFSGELDASSTGEMLSAITVVQGSAGYVAIERVEGSLNGKQGSFVLQHYGTMNKGKDQLVVEVVPDSGTQELTGLSGKMTIRIDEGQHYYDFDYELSE
ncbi:MAG: DUF3224 domain-containing protein [Arenicella sp.]